MKRKNVVFLLFVLIFCHVPSVWAWDRCDVTLDIPHGAIGVGESLTVTADGLEAGGVYNWSNYSYITPNGSTATVIGTKLSYSDYLRIGVTYSGPGGGSCSDTGWIWVKPGCTFSLSGENEMPLFGTPIEIAATPAEGTDGSFSWGGAESLAGNDRLALFTGTEAGRKTVDATYSTNTGGSCVQTHDIAVYKVQQVDGPSCANVGEDFIAQFTATTEPAGYESNVSITDDASSTISQQKEVTILGSVTEGSAEDDATTIMQLIDPTVSGVVGPVVALGFDMPNFLKILLDKIKGDGSDANFDIKFNRSKNLLCCNSVIKNGYGGGNLSFILPLKKIEISPKKLIPATGKLKKYLDYIPDFVKIIIAAEGSADMKVINDNLCSDPNSMAWSGEGNVGAKVSLALLNYDRSFGKGTIKVKTDLSGSTSLTETLSIEQPSTLVAKGGWGNLTVSGTAELIGLGLFNISQPFSKEIVDASPITTRVALPNILN